MDKLIMSKKEREQLTVFNKLNTGEITQVIAAQMLNLSVRWTRKKFKRYRLQGDSGLVHQGRGRPSSRRWNEDERSVAVDLLKSEWQGFGPTFTTEKLNEKKGIIVSNETVRKMMITEGFWVAKKKRRKYRQWRERKKIDLMRNKNL